LINNPIEWGADHAVTQIFFRQLQASLGADQASLGAQ
jgi:hypothetical protein